jgi:trans-2,3-dihydro-3-hydroxyanthranilate isomerase
VRSYRYLHLDVFTSRRFAGNQLAVFLDGRGLSTPTMQAIAKEMNFAETTFVLPPEQAATQLRLRIFTPEEEMPMAGHPTIGTTFALARAGVVGPETTELVLGLNVGPTPVALEWRGDELAFVWMTQRAPEFGEPLGDREGALAALRLPSSAPHDGLPFQLVSCGVPFLFVPLGTRRAVDAAALDAHAYAAFCGRAALDPRLPVFLFSAERAADDATVYSRMFAPGLGVSEDPATGGASGPLGCYLVRHGVVTPADASAILSLQGVKMGRPSHVHIAIGADNGDIRSVRVGGEAVVAGEGTLYVS